MQNPTEEIAKISEELRWVSNATCFRTCLADRKTCFVLNTVELIYILSKDNQEVLKDILDKIRDTDLLYILHF